MRLYKSNAHIIEREMRQNVQETIEVMGLDVAPVFDEVLEYLKKTKGIVQYVESEEASFSDIFTEDTASEAMGMLEGLANLIPLDGNGDLARYTHVVNLIVSFAMGANPMYVMMDMPGFGAHIARLCFGLVRLYPEAFGLKESEG